MIRTRFLPIMLIAVVVGACAAGPRPADEAVDFTDVPVIPRTLLFENPERTQARISPGGSRLSYIAPVDGVLNIWVQTLGADDARPVTADTGRGVRIHFWAKDGKHLLYLQDKGGDENWHVHRVDPATGEDVVLTPFEGVRAGIVALSKRLPGEMLITLNKRDRTLFDVHRLDLETGEVVEDTQNPGNVLGWLADDDLKVRAAVAMDGNGNTQLLVRDGDDDEWRILRAWSPLEEGDALDFSADGRSLLIADNKDTDTKRLFSLEIESGKITEIFHDPSADMVGAMLHPDTKTVEAVAVERLRKKWTLLDKSVAADLEALRGLGDDDFGIAARSNDNRRWVVYVNGDTHATRYYLYDRDAGKAEFLFDSLPQLGEYRLAPMKPVVIEARDGLELVSYLTLPPGSDPKGLPMVLLVHGGPWSRDGWGYDSQAQWLANRGYVVLQPNFRGSSGFGKDFLNAGNKEWGRRMQDDLTDAVGWAVETVGVDPGRVGIMGGSYGGYAALAGVTFTPDLYAAAVDIVGPSNLITLMNSIPPYWKPMMAIFSYRLGDMETEKEMLEARSPLNFIDRIITPLIIFQGANDPRVKQAESDQIVEAIRGRGGRVDYVVYGDEGHGFARPPNRIDFIGRAEQFLAEHLGGRVEPFEPSEGTTAEVR